jgi:hypothetical protein
VPWRCFTWCAACADMRLRIEIPAKPPEDEESPPENVDESEAVDRVEDEEPSRWRLIEIDDD